MTTRPMSFYELRLACAELAATRAMHLEAEREHAEVVLVRELARRRVTQRPSRWGKADRKLWREHRAVQRSLRALAREHHQRVLAARRAEDACPACMWASPYVGIG